MSGDLSLSAAQAAVVSHRGGDLQIIACAGAGKTEAISRRVAGLLADGAAPDSIIAFTFTEKAGAELKERIYRRAEKTVGADFLDKLGPMFVGTVHGWCFHALQERIPRFGDYEVIDEHRHVAFLSREAKLLGLKDLAGNRHWDGVREWIRIVDVVGNELMDEAALEESGLLDRYAAYLDLLDRFRFLTFSRVISEAVRALEHPELGPRVRGNLRYLIVDEYQDINPAQERLIRLLAGKGAEICVVGDDDQAIYQWRGSDVSNIVTFSSRRSGVKEIGMLENRRSLPGIVSGAADFSQSIHGRIPKRMAAVREGEGSGVVCWKAETDIGEAETIAEAIAGLRAAGMAYGKIAVLYRSVKTASGPLIQALKQRRIPFSAGGRTGLFATGEISAIGEIYAFLCDFQWRDGSWLPYRDAAPLAAAASLMGVFPGTPDAEGIAGFIADWKSFYKRLNTKTIDLVGDYYRFLDYLGLPASLDPDNPVDSSRLGSLARFSTLLADYEHIARRGRFHDEDGQRVYRAGMDRGKSFWFGLGNYLLHYAFGSYEDYEGEASGGSDAVQILTVHQAKGLEWPVVFLPSLVEGRFPSSQTGKTAEWPFPLTVFPESKRERYAGTDADERRLFYTAMTRARDSLYCSCFERKKNSFKPSPYLLELAKGKPLPVFSELPLPIISGTRTETDQAPIEISFSEAASWGECGYRYRLSDVFGFEQRLAEELGYGKAVHHALRLIAEHARETGQVPGKAEAIDIAQAQFYAPFADAPSRERMLASVGNLVGAYTEEYADDLRRVWATERPFELHTADGLLTGRADVILDEEGGKPGSLAIVDYKVAKNDKLADRYENQLRIYAHAGQREGWDVRGAYLHSLHEGKRESVGLDPEKVAAAVSWAEGAIAAIRRGDFPQRPSIDRCGCCDFSKVCRYRDRACYNETGV